MQKNTFENSKTLCVPSGFKLGYIMVFFLHLWPQFLVRIHAFILKITSIWKIQNHSKEAMLFGTNGIGSRCECFMETISADSIGANFVQPSAIDLTVLFSFFK